MPSFFDLQKFAATGIASPDMTAYDKARALAAFGGGKTQTLTGVPPLEFPSKTGKPLISWSMKGNGQQTGTPTHDAPIMPTFCGVRTRNLWDSRGFSARGITSTHEHTDANAYGTTLSTTIGKEVVITQSEYPTGSVGYQNGFFFIDVDFSKYEIGDKITLSFDYIVNEVHALGSQTSTTLYAGKNSNAISPTLTSGDWNISGRLTAVITIIADMSPYVEVRLCGNSITVKNIMLNDGTEPFPYEPNGYKLGISSGGENLWDEEYPNISGTIRYIPLYVGNGSFTLSTTTPYDSSVANLFLLSGNVSSGASTAGNGAWLNHNVTAQSDSGYITIAYRIYTGTTSPADCKTMLNLGSTAKPYSTYNRTTTSVYLGEVPTVRRIKKLVFDGSEPWVLSGSIVYIINTDTERLSPLICTHFPNVQNSGMWNGNNCIFQVDISNLGMTGRDAWIAYLQQQYAAGTPVTVWYVLSTPTTGIVNEPLAKIGDYADELHSSDTTMSIPTVKGENVLTVDTELQPSSMTITYKK